MEKHIGDYLQSLVGEKVAICFTDNVLLSGELTFDETENEYLLLQPNDLKTLFSKENVKRIRRLEAVL